MARRNSGGTGDNRRRTSGGTASGGGVITFVQSAANFSNAASTGVTIPYTSNVTAGNLLIIGSGGFATQSVSDSLSNTWTQATTVTSNNYIQDIWYAIANASGACTVTVTTATSQTFCSCAVAEYHSTGIGTWHLDQTNQAGGTGGAQASGNVTTTHAPEALCGWNTCAISTGLTSGSGWTSRQAASTYTLYQDQIATTTGTFNSTSTSASATWGANIATFYVA